MYCMHIYLGSAPVVVVSVIYCVVSARARAIPPSVPLPLNSGKSLK